MNDTRGGLDERDFSGGLTRWPYLQKTKSSEHMTKPKAKTTKATTAKESEAPKPKPTGAQLAAAAIRPSINAAIVTHTFQGNLLGKDVAVDQLVDALLDDMEQIEGGDLSKVEAMLYAQASALQTMFTSLAKRAHLQESLKQYASHMGFALKAQAQSRATIQTLIELKFPRQVAFVKQANIAQGHQQINNGTPPAQSPSHASNSDANLKNELLEAPDGKLGKGLDNGTARPATRGNSTVEAVGKSHRTTKRRR